MPELPEVETVRRDLAAHVLGARIAGVAVTGERSVRRQPVAALAMATRGKAFADAVQKARPAGAKGTFINRVAISSTMGPGVKVEPASLFGQ